MSTVAPFACDHCGSEWRSPISAAMCCDPAAFSDLDDDRPPRSSGIHRSID